MLGRCANFACTFGERCRLGLVAAPGSLMFAFNLTTGFAVGPLRTNSRSGKLMRRLARVTTAEESAECHYRPINDGLLTFGLFALLPRIQTRYNCVGKSLIVTHYPLARKNRPTNGLSWQSRCHPIRIIRNIDG